MLTTADKLAVTAAMVFPSLATFVYFEAMSGQASQTRQAAYVVGKALQFGFPAFWALAVMRERLDWRRPSGRGVAGGIAFAAAALAAMFALYYGLLKPLGVADRAAQAIGLRLTRLGLGSPARYLAFAVFVALGHSFLEEYYWRWFVFRRLLRWGSPAAAYALGSAAFMGHHLVLLGSYFGWDSPWTYLFSLAVAAGGGVWSWMYQRSGSLLGPWISHVMLDIGILVIGADLVWGL